MPRLGEANGTSDDSMSACTVLPAASFCLSSCLVLIGAVSASRCAYASPPCSIQAAGSALFLESGLTSSDHKARWPPIASLASLDQGWSWLASAHAHALALQRATALAPGRRFEM